MRSSFWFKDKSVRYKAADVRCQPPTATCRLSCQKLATCLTLDCSSLHSHGDRAGTAAVGRIPEKELSRRHIFDLAWQRCRNYWPSGKRATGMTFTAAPRFATKRLRRSWSLEMGLGTVWSVIHILTRQQSHFNKSTFGRENPKIPAATALYGKVELLCHLEKSQETSYYERLVGFLSDPCILKCVLLDNIVQ